MSYLLTAVFGLLLLAATVIAIVTAVNDNGQRPSGSQSQSEVVLYGGR